MSPLSTRYSYKDRKSTKKLRFRTLTLFLLILVLFLLFTEFVLGTVQMGSRSMEPNYEVGDCYLYHPLSKEGNVDRGELVIIQPPYYKDNSFLVRFSNLFLRIISLQNLEITSWDRKDWERERLIKRVIGLPGDQIYVEKGIVYVKPRGEEFFLSEFETSSQPYDIQNQLKERGEGFGGSLSELTLNPGEYFVMGDNRSLSSDSLSWGIIQEDEVKAVILLRYWPLKRFGKI